MWPYVVGVVVALGVAQVIDGRVAVFVGAGCALSIVSWRAKRRGLGEYIGIAVASAVGAGVYFILLGIAVFQASALLAWVALLSGLAVTFVAATTWSRRRIEAAAMRELGMPRNRARAVLEQQGRGDHEGAIGAIRQWQGTQREALKESGIDFTGLEPEVGKLMGWDQILRHVFRVLDFDRTDTIIDAEGWVEAASDMRPYGYLRVESPILNQPIRVPIIHRDDFTLADSVYNEPRLSGLLANGEAELLVVYAPQKVLKGGLNGTLSHCLHYAMCPIGTLERYYAESVGGDRMAQPAPEILFGSFVYDGEIGVGHNSDPAL